MDRAEVIMKFQDWMKEYKIHRHDAILTCGSAAILHNLRVETNDLDIDVTHDVFDHFTITHKVEKGLLGLMINVTPMIAIHLRDPTLGCVREYGILYDTVDTLLKQRIRIAYHPDRNPEKIGTDMKEIMELHQRWFHTTGQYVHVG